ncbi:exosortase F system-associated membrane protein [Leeuwenhoekiella palythoae]|uniref:exosortase F system-associated membrane protein n=1 Tax=Leeuwenhoekiella palythoae TaxID=573501 RepID=UPI00351891CA
MKLFLKISIVSAAIFCLIAIRYWQVQLFYDPLLRFFKGEYLQSVSLPELDALKLYLHVILRFWLNSALSILILVVLFPKKEIFRIALLLYGCLFLLLIIAFVTIIGIYDAQWSMLLFYVRRFLIQPILLLVLVPAFYYQKLLSKT